jgi:hypothetical protein
MMLKVNLVAATVEAAPDRAASPKFHAAIAGNPLNQQP